MDGSTDECRTYGWRSVRLEALQSPRRTVRREAGVSQCLVHQDRCRSPDTSPGKTNHGGGYRPVRLALAFAVAIAGMMLFVVATTDSASAAPKTGSVTAVVPTDQLPAGVSAATVTVTDFANQGGDLVTSGTATVTDAAKNAYDR